VREKDIQCRKRIDQRHNWSREPGKKDGSGPAEGKVNIYHGKYPTPKVATPKSYQQSLAWRKESQGKKTDGEKGGGGT